MIKFRKQRLAGPRRDAALAAMAVAIAYTLYFAARIVGGGEVEPVNAPVQVALQTLGIGVLVGLGSRVVRRFW